MMPAMAKPCQKSAASLLLALLTAVVAYLIMMLAPSPVFARCRCSPPSD